MGRAQARFAMEAACLPVWVRMRTAAQGSGVACPETCVCVYVCLCACCRSLRYTAVCAEWEDVRVSGRNASR